VLINQLQKVVKYFLFFHGNAKDL